jgi:hypothetical protein
MRISQHFTEPEISLPYPQEPSTGTYTEQSNFLILGLLSGESAEVRGPLQYFVIFFYGKELSVPRPTPKLEDHPLSAVCDCLFNIFTAILRI